MRVAHLVARHALVAGAHFWLLAKVPFDLLVDLALGEAEEFDGESRTTPRS